MVLPASPPDHEPGQGSWIAALELELRLSGDQSLLVLVDDARPERLRDLVLGLLPKHPELEVHTEVQKVYQVPEGAVVILSPRARDADWLNQQRPVFSRRGLKVILFCEPAITGVLRRNAPDFFDWISHQHTCPPGVAMHGVHGIQAALCARAPGIVWTGGDLDACFRTALPGRALLHLSAKRPLSELVETIRGAGPSWIVWHDVDDFRSDLVALALTRAKRASRVIVEGDILFPLSWPRLHGQCASLHEAASRLADVGARAPGRIAALLGLEPEAIQIAWRLLHKGMDEQHLEKVVRDAQDPGAALALLEGMPAEEEKSSLLPHKIPPPVLRAFRSSIMLRASRLEPELDAQTMTMLAERAADQGSLEEAETLARHALDLTEQESGPSSDVQAEAMHRLARVLTRRGRFEEARALLERALEITRKAGRKDSREMLDALADILTRQGHHERGKELTSRASTFERAQAPHRVERKARFDVLVLTALKEELDALLELGEGGRDAWHKAQDLGGFPYHHRIFPGAQGASISVAAAWIGEMGQRMAAIRGHQLAQELDSDCLAMCGICAGYKEKVALGDIIVADRWFAFEEGKRIAEPGVGPEQEALLFHDLKTFDLEATWKVKVTYLADEIDLHELSRERPPTREAELRWLLHALYDHESEGGPALDKHPERRRACPGFSERVKEARAEGLIERKGRTFQLTEKGRDWVDEDIADHPDGIPEPAPIKVHVGPIATMNAVIEDERIFPRLRKLVRTTIGLDMEGAALGELARQIKKPAILVKAVQDYADGSKNDRFRAFACRASAFFLLAFLQKHFVPPRPSTPPVDNDGNVALFKAIDANERDARATPHLERMPFAGVPEIDDAAGDEKIHIVTDLEGEDFRGQDCSSRDFRDVLLDDADFRKATLVNADCSRASMVGAKLSHADLTGANLAEADLRDANFSFARLIDADLSGVGSIEAAQFRGASLLGARGLGEDTSATLLAAGAAPPILGEVEPMWAVGSTCLAVAFSPCGELLALGLETGAIWLADLVSGKIIRVLVGHRDRVHSVAFSPDGKRLASGSSDRTIALWDAQTGERLRTFKGHQQGVLSVAFSPDGKWLLSGSDDRTIILWDLETGEHLHICEGHQGRITSVSFSPDGHHLASSSRDGTVKLWHVASGQCLVTYLHTPEGLVAFSPDGRYKRSGAIDGSFWHVTGLCRFEPGELDLELPDDADFFNLPPPPASITWRRSP